MAEAFLSLGVRDRADILQTVAARSGRAAIILEKDIWVCWVPPSRTTSVRPRRKVRLPLAAVRLHPP